MKTKDIKFYSQDLDKEVTIKEYLIKLLVTLWREEAGFSGKRPFGSSDWQFEIYKVLIEHGVVEGSLDEDGYVDQIDIPAADKIIVDEVIKKL